jgi:hypothetical protein
LYVVSLHGRLLLRFHQPHEVAGYHYSAIGTVYLPHLCSWYSEFLECLECLECLEDEEPTSGLQRERERFGFILLFMIYRSTESLCDCASTFFVPLCCCCTRSVDSQSCSSAANAVQRRPLTKCDPQQASHGHAPCETWSTRVSVLLRKLHLEQRCSAALATAAAEDGLV